MQESLKIAASNLTSFSIANDTSVAAIVTTVVVVLVALAAAYGATLDVKEAKA